MAITVDKLINDDRFSGDNVFQFLLYLPFGIVLLLLRSILALLLWIASIILPYKSTVRHMLSLLACGAFGVHVKLKGTRDPRCSILVANYVSCLDSLAASHVLGTISLRKWKVPPFFAATLGIRNAAQFMRKQHFADNPSKPILLQPEGGPTNGNGLLKFTDWPFSIGNRVQPVAISVSRPFSHVTVHRAHDSRSAFPWSDALWFLWTPATTFTVRLLPSLDRLQDDDAAFVARIRRAIADALQVEMTEWRWEELNAGAARTRQVASVAASSGASGGASVGASAAERLARQVKEVLPLVPMTDILRDLAVTRSVDVTITNFLEGVTPYTPEPLATPSSPAPAAASHSRYITPQTVGVFPKSARERQLTFQERKAQMIEEARTKYIEKHGLNLALNNC